MKEKNVRALSVRNTEKNYQTAPQKQTNKGITLIALIITIIILLILAMVSIRLIINDGIIGKAEKATTDYSTAEEKEQIQLGYSEYQMAKAQGEANPTIKVEGATVTGDETIGWTITFNKTGNVYGLNSTGEIGKTAMEKLKDDILQNKETYLTKAAAVGQNTASNTDIGIGTDGNIVNLDLWNYRTINENEIAIVGEGSNGGGYKGTSINPIMPQYILLVDQSEFFAVTSLGDASDAWSQPFDKNTTIQEFRVADTVTNILYYSFAHCTSLKVIYIPNSVTRIGIVGWDNSKYGSVFNESNALEEIIIDNSSTTDFGGKAPWGAPSTTKITYLR